MTSKNKYQQTTKWTTKQTNEEDMSDVEYIRQMKKETNVFGNIPEIARHNNRLERIARKLEKLNGR